MTISSSITTAGAYTGNGSVDTYAYGFRITDESMLRVIETDTGGTPTVLTLNVDYTVTGVGDAGGGDIVLTSPLTNLYTLYATLVPDTLQETSFNNQGDYNPEIHEDAIDKLTLMLAYVKRLTSNAVALNDDSDNTGVSGELPSAVPYATLSWNDDGTEIINGSLTTDIAAAAGEAIAAAASAAAALTSENNAATSESNASTSEGNASTYASNASNSADAAAADVALTNADVVLTNADVVSTGDDVTATNADVVLTNADVVLTNADVVLTGNDVTATNADVVLTGDDVTATNADVVSTGDDVTAAAASAAAAAASAAAVERVVLTQAAYDALTPVETTTYIIVG